MRGCAWRRRRKHGHSRISCPQPAQEMAAGMHMGSSDIPAENPSTFLNPVSEASQKSKSLQSVLAWGNYNLLQSKFFCREPDHKGSQE